MIKDLTAFYSKNSMNMQRSEIREILKLSRQPDIISFAGGLPSPDAFPTKEIEEITCDVIQKRGALALQYGPTEGEMPLRQQLAAWMSASGKPVAPENILITTGSQQGLDILSKVFVDPGDVLVVELPTYIGGLQAFSAYRASLMGVNQDDHGMRMDLLEETLVNLAEKQKKPKFIYVVPDFQNPSGVTLTAERRRRLLELAYRYEIPVVEDSPYRDLRFTGEPQPPIYGLDDQHQVIVLGTFSKIFCPGLRLAWMMAPKEWTDRMVIAKQSMDLASPTFNQLIAAEYMRRGLLPKQIESIRTLYGKKRDLMIKMLKEHMPSGVSWTEPEGGLFLWIRLPEHMNATELFPKAIEQKVAYVVGSAFHCNGKGHNTMRLNFSYATEEQIEEGIKRLATMIKLNL
jgi:2-aminoadipate transaminase